MAATHCGAPAVATSLSWSALPSSFKHALYAAALACAVLLVTKVISDPVHLFRASTVRSVRAALRRVDADYTKSDEHARSGDGARALLCAGAATGTFDAVRSLVGDAALESIGQLDVDAYSAALRTREGHMVLATKAPRATA